MFSGALGAVGVAASVGVLDQPANMPKTAKTSTVIEQTVGGNSTKETAEEKVANLASKPQPEQAKKTPVVTPAAVLPAFDILRVEKDGSTLIAGHAQPDSSIEIFDGEVVVATTETASNGDFVAILEKPLSPGDHQLEIRSTGKDSKILVSAETGLVSVPIEKGGELLAMVMKPGEASRIIQKPTASKPAEKIETAKLVPATSVAKSANKANEGSEIAPASKIEVAVETSVTEEPKAPIVVEIEKTPTLAKETVQETASKTVMAAESKPEQIEKPAAIKIEQTVGKVIPATEVAPAKETENTDDQQVATLAPPVKSEPASTNEPEIVSVEKTANSPAIPAKKPVAEVEPVKVPTIVVEAVEVDGPSMFIAGAAEPGHRVALYVDNKLVGFADGSREGRFLLEVERKLSRGEHLVRADIYDANGNAVAARAEVPLIHEPEEPAIVVAKIEPAPKPELEKIAPTKLEMVEKPEIIEETKVEPAEVKTKPEKKRVPVAKVEPATPTAIKIEPMKEVEAVTASSEPIAKKPESALENLAENAPEKPKQVAAIKVAITDVQNKVVDKPVAKKSETDQPEKPAETRNIASAPTAKSPEKTVAPEPVEAVVTKTPVVLQAQVEVPKKEAKTVAQPAPEVKKEVKVASAKSAVAPARKVLRTGSSVIIRRGDSLWRISYRTYGRGIRYSTIYQANLRQLRSPHRIYPGQILKVPKTKFPQQG